MILTQERAEGIRLIRESANVIANRSDLKRVRDLRFKTLGFDPSVLRMMADMGWIGLIVPQERGGAGLGVPELCALAEELGAALVPEPLIHAGITSALLSGEPLSDAITGNRIILLAWQEEANSLHEIGETTFRSGRISGVKICVPMAAGADDFLVSCREGLALVSSKAKGIKLDVHLTQDGGHYGSLYFDDAAAELITETSPSIINQASLATAAYLLGVIETSMSLTIEYLNMRQQFGSAIGTFQSLQHRAVDLSIQQALTRASVESAAILLDSDAPQQAKDAAVSRAKVRAADTAMFVTRQGVQMHGGIGYTDEADIGLFLRKAMVLGSAYGSAKVHRERYAKLLLPTEI
ncbi:MULTISPECIES: acyl-CoA dehydrogenase family protein [unclassified Afipia]|uniref:acyl-CoA dehydrogenase family protein n=1 Tax=unclassified Afipia TaxID=2642050 RepID=UPI000467098C|nr:MULTISPECIES: acyl-CoA dehydrogenase family protein [unclassified Afipia]